MFGVQQRQLLEAASGVPRSRRAGEGGGQLLSLVEADRDEVGVDLGNLDL
jgi:hypothetical protein